MRFKLLPRPVGVLCHGPRGTHVAPMLLGRRFPGLLLSCDEHPRLPVKSVCSVQGALTLRRVGAFL